MGAGFPTVPGHEIIGHVAALGEGITAWKVGDQIGGGWHGGHDGMCFLLIPRLAVTDMVSSGAGSSKLCKQGFFQACDNRVVNGETKGGGCKCFLLEPKLISTRIISH